MATQVEQPLAQSFEKVVAHNSQFAEKFLSIFKKVMNNLAVLPETERTEIKETTREYLQNSLSSFAVHLPNIDELSEFLVKNTDAIYPIVSICHDITKHFTGLKGLRLVYEVETEDMSGAESVTLYLQGVPFTSDSYKEIEQIENNYIDYFVTTGVVFTVQMDTKF